MIRYSIRDRCVRREPGDIILKHYYDYEKKILNVFAVSKTWEPYAMHGIDLSNCSREQFMSRIKKLVPRFRYQSEFVEFRKVLRRLIYAPRAKSWYDVLPQNVATWLEKYMWDIVEEMNEHCVDNLRAACVNSTAQKRRYKSQQKHGCCGFYDETVLCPIDGKHYFIGFNYGH